MGAGSDEGADGRARSREFRDVAGHLWVVIERQIPSVEWTPSDEESSRAGYGVGWLWFASSRELPRRLRLYPMWWPSLSDEALEQLRTRAREDASGGA